jgi:CubicO group peptidase (beta-lactamase class C family)
MALPPDAAASDPARLQLMQGFPPSPAQTVRFDDDSSWMFPRTRWSFCHQRELVPTANIWRGAGPAHRFDTASAGDLDAIAFKTMDGRAMTWGESLAANYTDGILVLHRGRIVYERYFGALRPHLPHVAMSVTKSFTGLLAAMLQHEGALDPDSLVTRHVPEMQGTAYADTTVRQVMDMTVGVRYSELYTDPNAEIWQYAVAGNAKVPPKNYAGPDNIFAFLRTLQKEGAHGQAFAYKTCNSEVLGWIVQRVAGTHLAELVSERLWQPMGAEENAYIIVDKLGMPVAGGGLSLCLRDLARFGEMMRQHGAVNGRQVVPEAVVADIARGADRAHFAKAGIETLPGWSYRHQWWVSHDTRGTFAARGIHGQTAWIVPKAELVIARFASHPVAANGNGPLDHVSLPAFEALADALSR